MIKLRDLTLRQYAKLLGPYAILMIGGSLLAGFYSEHWWLSDFVRRFAEACTIAGILAIVVELFSANRLIHHVSEDLAAKLIGKGLPPKIQEAIGDLTKTHLVRETFIKTMRINDPQNGHLAIDITISYRVKNFGEDAENFAPYLGEESFYSPEFNFLQYTLNDGCGHSFNKEELAALVQTKEDTRVKSINGPKPLSIKPLRRSPESYCDVTCRYRVTMPHEYSDILSLSAPTLSVKVHIERSPPGYKVFAGGVGGHRLGQSDIWDFEGPFLRGQHVRVWWFPQSQEDPPPLQESSSDL